ncbi:MAG: hypothetical protein ABIX01_19115 [Chitinophagaceae bacterium]
MKKPTLFLLIVMLVIACTVFSQPIKKERLKVFVDCNSTYCDLTFIRTEINIVDFVLDRLAADVHVLITSQQLGSGASQYQMIFFGQQSFKNTIDTLLCNSSPNTTESEIRDLQVQYIKVGLLSYIAKKGYLQDVTVGMKLNKADSGKTQAKTNQATIDKWNYWVYRVNANGNVNADKNYNSNRLSLNISANRITDKWKLNLRADANRNNSVYTYENTSGGIEKIKVNNSGWSAYHRLVKSLGEHWSVGYEASAYNSIFSNIKTSVTIGPAIEYAIFPYKNVTTRFFTFQYGINYKKNNYYDTTLYLKKNENLGYQYLNANLSFNQKWGTFSTSINYLAYFHDLSVNNFNVYLNADVRITGGLSFYTYAYGGLVHDQLYLPKGDASINDVLARRRQLASDFNFNMGFGISYRFGSILNNFVNPRLDGVNN